MSPFKDLKLNLETLNPEGTYSEGDTIIGTITFNLKHDTKVKSISVKAKGDADVYWTEGFGDTEESYSAKVRYFKTKEYLVVKTAQGTVLPRGNHVFKFELKLPQEEMPSSFKGKSGKIVYLVVAKIGRRWRWPTSVETEIKFISKSFPQIQEAMCPQSSSVDKKVGIFSKGEIQMSASVNRGVCSPGDTLTAHATINNYSSKDVKPKFTLHQKTVCRAKNDKDTRDKTIFKMVGDTIPPRAGVTVPCQVKIPDDADFTLHNCEIISVEYYLKVYLDISFAFDPEVVFPVIVVPSNVVSALHNEDLGPTWACS